MKRPKEVFLLAQCKKCGRPASIIQIDDTNDPACDWELSCGCGTEPHYSLGELEQAPEFIPHVARKNWSTFERMATLVALRDQLGWGKQ